MLTATSRTLPSGRLHSETLAAIFSLTSAKLAATSTSVVPLAADVEADDAARAPARAEAREDWEVTECVEGSAIVPEIDREGDGRVRKALLVLLEDTRAQQHVKVADERDSLIAVTATAAIGI